MSAYEGKQYTKELSRVPRTLSESSNTKYWKFYLMQAALSCLTLSFTWHLHKWKTCSVTAGSPSTILWDHGVWANQAATETDREAAWFPVQQPTSGIYHRTERPKIEHPIENTFEAALYRLGTSNLSVAYAMNGKTQYKFIQILDRFEIKDNFGTKSAPSGITTCIWAKIWWILCLPNTICWNWKTTVTCPTAKATASLSEPGENDLPDQV